MTVGLVGYGAVPQALAPLLQAFGCRILYTASGRKTGVLGSYRRLSALLAQSDVVSLHLPLTEKTERIMDAAAFAQMKSGAVLVNTARGGLVDHAALVAGAGERDGWVPRGSMCSRRSRRHRTIRCSRFRTWWWRRMWRG